MRAEAYRIRSTTSEIGPPDFWFLQLFARLSLPGWCSALLLTGIAFGGFTALDWLMVGSPGSLNTLYLPFHLAYFALTAMFLGHATERILDYAKSLGADGADRMRRTLYNKRWPFLVALPIEAAYLGPKLTAPGFALPDLFRNADLLGIFHVMVGASAVWAFAYSMKILRDLGRTSLSLKPFTQDRTLGLRPFGRTVLWLVAIYEIGILVGVIPMVIDSTYDLPGVITFGVLGLAGLALFFVPLQSFRHQMRDAKARELSWIGPKYEELVKAVRDSHGSHIDDEIVGSLSALDKIQRDVERIHTWPFDGGIVTRLASVTILPMLVTVLAREIIILTLHV